MKMEIIENAPHGHNWCTMCALEPFCDKTHIESELYPCTNSHGKTNRYLREYMTEEHYI